MKDAYVIYIEKFGKVQSGSRIEDQDYKQEDPKNVFVEFDERGKLAVALAADDAKKNITLRTRSNFEQELKRLSEK